MNALFLALLLPLSAFASHPHDRVCVGSAEIPSQGPVQFTLQWEIGREYVSGNPSEDTHFLVLEASSCYEDYYMGDECLKSTTGSFDLSAEQRDNFTAPVTLKDSKGNIFFTGTFSWAKDEILNGKIAKGPGKSDRDPEPMAPVKVKLSCIGQPLLTLDPKKQ